MKTTGFLVVLGLAATTALTAAAADVPAAKPAAAPVSRVTKAINYSRASSSKVDFRGTELMQAASGEAKVQSRTGRVDVEVKVIGLDPATKFGLEYLTYVLWAVSPQGRADNLGELLLDKGAAHLKTTTELQTFGMIVTAEPYFAVTQPSNVVVLENAVRPDTAGKEELIDSSYELLPRGAYSSSNQRISDAIFGIDPRTPLELFEARNALRIARNAGADKYAGHALEKAEQSLSYAETAYRQKQKREQIDTYARDASQTAEDARVMAVKEEVKEREQMEAAQREAAARAQAEAEIQRRKQAELDRANAEAAKAEAERMKQEALAAAAQAAKAKAEADTARAAAVAQQQALAQQTEQAKLQADQARQQADQARQQAEQARQQTEQAEKLRQQAEQDKAEMRAHLLQQLNAVLETRDSARGLISNMGDVLFETGKYELKPMARERLARVSGILLAYPGLNVQIDGYTDATGSDDFNQKLSEQRAEAVRAYLVQAGVSSGVVSAEGLGKADPIASNDTPDGRQKNRRVELVVSGDAIGANSVGNAPATVGPHVVNTSAQR